MAMWWTGHVYLSYGLDMGSYGTRMCENCI